MRKWKVPRITGRSALGLVSTTVTSFGPVAFTLSICSASTLAFEAVAGSLWRMIEYTTSAGDNALPSWKVTPLRSVKTQVLASVVLNDSARAARGVRLLSSEVSPL